MRDPVIYSRPVTGPRPRLGRRQLNMLRAVGTTAALVVPCALSRRLCDLGLMTSEPDGYLARITPAGLRALADAAEAGRVKLFEPPARKETTP